MGIVALLTSGALSNKALKLAAAALSRERSAPQLSAVLSGRSERGMKHAGMAVAALLVLTGAPSLPQATGADELRSSGGSIFVAGVPEPTPGDKGLGNPAGGIPEPYYSVQVDRGDIVRMPRPGKGDKPSTLLEGLSLDSRHLIAIRHKGTPIESFYYRFPEGEPHQCLFLNELYLTWQIWPVKRTPWCKCNREPDNNQMQRPRSALGQPANGPRP